MLEIEVTEDKRISPEQLLYRWDCIWEFLLSRRNVREMILPGMESHRVVFKRDDSVNKKHYRKPGRYAIACLEQSKTLTITFYAENPGWIGMEALTIALNHAEHWSAADIYPSEGYDLPDVRIIDFSSSLPAQLQRMVDLRHGEDHSICTRFNFLVVHVGSYITELRGLSSQLGIEETRHQLRRLYDSLRESKKDKQLLLRCAMLADPQLYSEGYSRPVVPEKLLGAVGGDTSGKGVSRLQLGDE